MKGRSERPRRLRGESCDPRRPTAHLGLNPLHQSGESQPTVEIKRLLGRVVLRPLVS
jgi:hypothetical protein